MSTGNKFQFEFNEPVFLKEYDRESNLQLAQLTDLLEKVGDDQKGIIEEEIKKIKAGLYGEKNVAYELQTSFLPILCLHNIRVEYRDYSAQFDFVVITNKCIFVLETKTMLGDIIIDSYGNFTRVFKNYKGEVYKKEGIASPINQNEKHVEILDKFLLENNMHKDIPIVSLVVIANPKSIIEFKYAKREIREKIIKFDQIKKAIQDTCMTLDKEISSKEMVELAEFILESDKPIKYDYIKRFNLKIVEPEKEEPENTLEKSLDDTLFEKLKEYRFDKAKENNQPLWFIYTNDQLADLILNKPKNKEEFISIPGFGERKYELYGEDIIKIIWDKEPEKVNHEAQVINEKLYEELRRYRFEMSKKENIKPYFIYTNEELEQLCIHKPTTKDEFVSVKGFGIKKYEKYGEDIINIIKKYT